MSDLTDQLDDIQQSVDDQDQRLTDTEGNVQQHDDSIADHEDRLTNTEQSVTDLDSRAGQLDFPLTQDSIDRIKEVFPTLSAQLVAGAVTVTDPRIGLNTVILYSVRSAGGTPGTISWSVAAGSATFSSTSSGDTSLLAFVIF